MTGKTLDYHKTYPNLPWFVAEQLQLQMQTLWAVQEICENLEAQQETPASPETPSSSQATAPTEDDRSGNGTSSVMFSLVRTDHRGSQELRHTFRAPNSQATVGDVLRSLLELHSTPRALTELGSQWPSGQTLSTTPAAVAAGPSAGGSEPSPDPSPSAAAPSAIASSEDRSIGEIAEEWVSGECAICEHPRKDHTLRGRCTWMMCQCSINSLAFLNITPTPSPESAAQPGREEKPEEIDYAQRGGDHP